MKVWLQTFKSPKTTVLCGWVSEATPSSGASAAFILFILLFIASWQSSWTISGSSLVVAAGTMIFQDLLTDWTSDPSFP